MCVVLMGRSNLLFEDSLGREGRMEGGKEGVERLGEWGELVLN